MSAETWKEIPGFGGMYAVSSMGRVKSFHRAPPPDGTILRASLNRAGYCYYKLNAPGGHVFFFEHRLVAAAFLKNHNNKRTINHINGNKRDNRLSNLEWATHAENTSHAFRTGLRAIGDKHCNAKLTVEKVRQLRALRSAGATYKVLAKQFGVTFNAVWSAANGKTWRHAA